MVGWYVDVGYTTGSTPKKLSDITWTDMNRPYSLIETATLSDWDGDGYDELSNAINTNIGSDQRAIFLPISFYNEDRTPILTTLIPSLKNGYPNLYNRAIETKKFVYYALYFKSLNVLYYRNSRYLYEVLSDGTLISLDENGTAGEFSQNTCQFVALTKQYTDGFDFSDPDNYALITVDAPYPGYSRTSITVYRGASYGPLPANIFGRKPSTKPDFNIIPPDNPFEPGGPSEPGDLPPGTFDGESDAIPDSSLPTISAANTGFTRIYNPSLSQVQELAKYLWTDDTVLETIWNKIRQYFENPMDAIIGFNLVPVAVPNGGTKNFALMYIDTGVSMTAAASQFVDQDCGSVKLERYYGSALDQSPYTKVSCFLPYIGTVQLNTDEVMGTTLQVKYRVDIVSGSCVAKILVDGNVLYQYSGHCAINIPFSSSDFSTYVSAAISVAKLAVGAAAAGAAGLGAVGAADAGQQTNQVTTLTRTTTDTVRNPTTGRQITTGTHSVVETYESPVSESSTKASFSGLSPANISNTVGQIMASKPNVEHSGSFSGNTGYLGVRRPFLIIERPNMCLPKNYQTLNGYPAMITMKLGDCSGYTRIQQVQLTGMTATNPEQAEILSLLKSGVIF